MYKKSYSLPYYKDKDFTGSLRKIINQSLNLQQSLYWKIKTNWPIIMGDDFSSNSQIIKITKNLRPNALASYNYMDDSCDKTQKAEKEEKANLNTGFNLHIACAPAMKLEFEHRSGEIIETVNLFLGRDLIRHLVIKINLRA